jgi:uncharacterized protein (TIGR02300 family)
MANKKFGNKRICSNCDTKFYDLNKDSPLTCPHCKTEIIVDEDLVTLKNSDVFENKKPETRDEFADIDNNENDNDNGEDVISLEDAVIEEEDKN